MINSIIENVAKLSVQNKNNSDYYGDDGLLVCFKCHKKKQMYIEFPKGHKRLVGITCDCDKEGERLRKENERIERTQNYILSLYKKGLCDKAYLDNTFEKDDGNNPKLTRLCRRYADKFEQVKEKSTGLLLYGDVGGGKSFFACCIANDLLKKGIPVLVTRLSELVRNRVDSNSETVNPRSFRLIVLDDIGVENNSQTAFNIVDEIYRAKIPLIVTTNLTPSEIKNPDSLEKKRIYDRILERCVVTIYVPVNKRRLDRAKKQSMIVKEIMCE